jgi:hypothetical protein
MAVKRRPSIGFDPLDAVVPQAESRKATEVVQPGPAPTKVEERAGGRMKERLTVHVPNELIDRVKNAVYWTPGLTLAELAEKALDEQVARLEHERGEPYPQRRSELKGGRPLK